MSVDKNTSMGDKTPQKINKPAKVAVRTEYSGPLPRASEFKAYEETLSGAADRILGMAEKSLDAEIDDMRRHRNTLFVNMILNKIMLYGLIAISVVLIFNNKPIEALLVGIAPIIQIISTIEIKKK